MMMMMMIIIIICVYILYIYIYIRMINRIESYTYMVQPSYNRAISISLTKQNAPPIYDAVDVSALADFAPDNHGPSDASTAVI